MIKGNVIPQEDILSVESGFEFFNHQSFTDEVIFENEVAGPYSLHPNNVGHCLHIANASYAVDAISEENILAEILFWIPLKRLVN